MNGEERLSGEATAAWQVREALPGDEAQLVALWGACGLLASYNDPGADFRMALASPSSTVLVAVETGGEMGGDRVIGSVMAGSDGHRGWLYYVAASPSHRGKGIGRAVVRAGEAWLAGQGIRKVQLLVRDTNAVVVAFYEALGYEVTPRTIMGRWLDPAAAPGP